MKFHILALFFIVPLLSVFAEGEVPSDVVVLTDSTFKDAVQKGDYLVEFYAPCKLYSISQTKGVDFARSLHLSTKKSRLN